MCTVWAVDTAEVVTANVAVVAPAGTVTFPLAGTLAALLSLANVITAPPVGAGLSSITVPLELLPPTTLVGFTLTEDKCATGVMVKVA